MMIGWLVHVEVGEWFWCVNLYVAWSGLSWPIVNVTPCGYE